MGLRVRDERLTSDSRATACIIWALTEPLDMHMCDVQYRTVLCRLSMNGTVLRPPRRVLSGKYKVHRATRSPSYRKTLDTYFSGGHLEWRERTLRDHVAEESLRIMCTIALAHAAMFAGVLLIAIYKLAPTNPASAACASARAACGHK